MNNYSSALGYWADERHGKPPPR